jgi:uncharacterized protein
MENITVIKCDIQNRETWRYSGRVLHRKPTEIQIEAFFNRPDIQFHGILLGQGDRFVETFYSDRWYNVFAMFDRKDSKFKGFYCNVTYPAEISDGVVRYIDLALDLLVYPDGAQLVLDRDEFEELSLSEEIRTLAETALAELKCITSKALHEINTY